MPRTFPPSNFSHAGIALFHAAGATEEDARSTVESLITSSLMGHDSHGVIRIPEYLGHIEKGMIKLDATITVERTGPGTVSNR